MSTHRNPITNVTPKERISKRIKEAMEVPNAFVRLPRVSVLESEGSKSLLEISMRKLGKYIRA